MDRSTAGGSWLFLLPTVWGCQNANGVPFQPPLPLLVMNSKRLWVATAIIFALSVFDPRSSGVWAQWDMTACRPGWEWVRLNQIQLTSFELSLKKDRLCLCETLWTIFFAEQELVEARSVYHQFRPRPRVPYSRQ